MQRPPSSMRWRTSPSAGHSARSGSATSRTSCCRIVAQDDLKARLRRARRARPRLSERRPHHRHHLLPRPRLLRPRHRALDPHRRADLRALRRFVPPGGHRRAEDQDLRLHQRMRPSPCRPYRHPRTGAQRRGVLPDHARRLGGRARLHRRDRRQGLFQRRSGGCGRDAGRHLHRQARERERTVLGNVSQARPGALQGGALWRCLKPSRAPSTSAIPLPLMPNF